MEDVAGKIAFITGGASGIGLGMAEAFVAAGMKAVLADIDEAALQRTAEKFRHQPNAVFPIRLDVSDLPAWEAAAEMVEREFGPVSILCNNAGITTGRAGVSQISAERWSYMMRINLGGVFNGSHTFVKRFMARGSECHIVNTGSIIGLFGNAQHDTSYTTCKFGIVGFSEALLFELEQTNIGVSVLCPAGVATGIALNSLRHQPPGESHPQPRERVEKRHATLGKAMRPRSVGEQVLNGIRRNDFFIITHPEYRPVVQARMHTLRSAFGKPAQPGYRENFRGPGKSWLEYSRRMEERNARPTPVAQRPAAFAIECWQQVTRVFRTLRLSQPQVDAELRSSGFRPGSVPAGDSGRRAGEARANRHAGSA